MEFSFQPIEKFAQAIQDSYHLTDLSLVKTREGQWKIGKKRYVFIPFLDRIISWVYARWKDPTSLHQIIEEFTTSQSKSYQKHIEKLEKDSTVTSEQELASLLGFQVLFDQTIAEVKRKCALSRKSFQGACWAKVHLQSAEEKLLNIFNKVSSAAEDSSLLPNFTSRDFIRQARLNLLIDKSLLLGELENLVKLKEIARSRFEEAIDKNFRTVRIEGEKICVSTKPSVLAKYDIKINDYIGILTNSLGLNPSVEGPKINPTSRWAFSSHNFALKAINSKTPNFHRWAVLASRQFRIEYLESRSLSPDQAKSLSELKEQKLNFIEKPLEEHFKAEQLAWKSLRREYKMKQESLRAFEKEDNLEKEEQPRSREKITPLPPSNASEAKVRKDIIFKPSIGCTSLSAAQQLYSQNIVSKYGEDFERFFLENVRASFKILMRCSIES